MTYSQWRMTIGESAHVTCYSFDVKKCFQMYTPNGNCLSLSAFVQTKREDANGRVNTQDFGNTTPYVLMQTRIRSRLHTRSPEAKTRNVKKKKQQPVILGFLGVDKYLILFTL